MATLTPCPKHPEKQRFPTKEAAHGMARAMMRKHPSTKLSPYRCTGCGDYHLTKRPRTF